MFHIGLMHRLMPSLISFSFTVVGRYVTWSFKFSRNDTICELKRQHEDFDESSKSMVLYVNLITCLITYLFALIVCCLLTPCFVCIMYPFSLSFTVSPSNYIVIHPLAIVTACLSINIRILNRYLNWVSGDIMLIGEK